MDRRVKERLIGASILVALIVLVVPELLSGPKPAAGPPRRHAARGNARADSKCHGGFEHQQAGGESRRRGGSCPACIRRDRRARSSRRRNPPDRHQSGAPNPSRMRVKSGAREHGRTPRIRRARPAAVESSARSPISQAHAWSVQLGSFASRANADNLTRQLKGQGFSVFVAPGGSGSSVRYRVRVGPLADRESAERMAAKLKTLGHISSLVSPGA